MYPQHSAEYERRIKTAKKQLRDLEKEVRELPQVIADLQGDLTKNQRQLAVIQQTRR